MTRRRTARRNAIETVYNGRVFRIERERVTLPGGHDVTMEAVRHRGSVVLIPQPSPGTVLLVRQYRHVIDKWIWELPAGSLEEGERPRSAARRECEEETGWRPRQVERLGAFYPSPGFCDELMTFYVCSELVRPAQPAHGDIDEQLEPRVFSVRQVRSLIDRGVISDMKTIVGMTLLRGKTRSSQK